MHILLPLSMLSAERGKEDLSHNYYQVKCFPQNPSVWFFFFYLKDSWFTMLCQFPVYSKVIDIYSYIHTLAFPGGSDGKEFAWNSGDLSSIPGLGRSPAGGHDYSLQYSCLEDPHGHRSLTGYRPLGLKESGTNEWLSTNTVQKLDSSECTLSQISSF